MSILIKTTFALVISCIGAMESSDDAVIKPSIVAKACDASSQITLSQKRSLKEYEEKMVIQAMKLANQREVERFYLRRFYLGVR